MFGPDSAAFDIREVNTFMKDNQTITAWTQETMTDMSYDGQWMPMKSVSQVNKKTSHVELIPLVDTTNLGKKPLCFILQDHFDYVYYVNNFIAAAKAVKQINHPENHTLCDKHAILPMLYVRHYITGSVSVAVLWRYRDSLHVAS
jgi:hypothetical protein